MTERDRFWMRPVSFWVLHRLVHRLAPFVDGVDKSQFDALTVGATPRPKYGESDLSRTTLWHVRNTLLHLGLLTRRGRRYLLARDHPGVHALLDLTPGPGPTPAPAPAELLFGLVLRDLDCYGAFFRLFARAGGPSVDGAASFLHAARPVVWMWTGTGKERAVRFIQKGTDDVVARYGTPSQVKSVVYGLRYWARDELRVVDEYYQHGKGAVLFPVARAEPGVATIEAIAALRELRAERTAWTTLSIAHLIECVCEVRRLPRAALFSAIEHFLRVDSGRVDLLPTPIQLAAFTAVSREAAELQLRSLYKDRSGRYISHVSFHGTLLEDRTCRRT